MWRTGYQVATKYYLVTADEFNTYFGVKPEPAGVPVVSDLQADDGTLMSGVVIKMLGCPEQLTARTITFFSEVVNYRDEMSLKPERQIRAKHAEDLFYASNLHAVKNRHESLACDKKSGQRQVQSIGSIKHAVEEYNRIAQVKEAGREQGAVVPEVPQVVSRRGMLFASTAQATAPPAVAKVSGVVASPYSEGERGPLF
jgi:hypothetical protein